MGKQAFAIGSLDKHGKNVKTADGWKPVKGNENLVSKEFKDQIAAPKEKAVKATPKEKTPAKTAPVKKAAAKKK